MNLWIDGFTVLLFIPVFLQMFLNHCVPTGNQSESAQNIREGDAKIRSYKALMTTVQRCKSVWSDKSTLIFCQLLLNLFEPFPSLLGESARQLLFRNVPIPKMHFCLFNKFWQEDYFQADQKISSGGNERQEDKCNVLLQRNWIPLFLNMFVSKGVWWMYY